VDRGGAAEFLAPAVLGTEPLGTCGRAAGILAEAAAAVELELTLARWSAFSVD
jgi:hypothetical protein